MTFKISRMAGFPDHASGPLEKVTKVDSESTRQKSAAATAATKMHTGAHRSAPERTERTERTAAHGSARERTGAHGSARQLTRPYQGVLGHARAF